MNCYALKQDAYIYSDCDFGSKVVGKLEKENDVFYSDKEIGAWMHIIKEDESINGWIYHYNVEGKDTLIESYKAGSLGVRIGDAVTIVSNMTYAKDYFGNILQVKDPDMTDRLFIVKDVILDPNRVKVVVNNKNFWFTFDKIVDTEAKKREGNRLARLASFDEIGENISNIPSDMDKLVSETANFLGLSYDGSEYMTDLSAYERNPEDTSKITATVLQNLNLQSIKGIMGCPYQFLPTADMRMDRSVDKVDALGVKYAEKIISKMPILLMCPGVPQFMRGYSDSERQTMIKKIAGISGRGEDLDTDKTALTKIIDQSGRFYDLYPAWPSYYRYIDPLCQMAAVLLGIGDVEMPYGNPSANEQYSARPGIPVLTAEKATLSRYRWEYATSEAISRVLNFAGGCAFYVNSETQVSEAMNSETTQSAIASKVNAISDQARELIFLSSASTKLLLQQNVNQMAASKTLEGTTGNEGGKSVMSSIIDGMGNVLTGGKMMFPELWSDSSFSRDYNISLKLVSPDCDKLSLYMNIVVPLIHLLGFAAPRSLGSNTYTSPFLVRAYYKGFFNVNMGIITSMSINKGGEGYWTYAGIPTQVEVNFSIKDLYGIMMLSMSSKYGDSSGDGGLLDTALKLGGMDILTNTVLMDYLCNLCGININEPDYARTMMLYKQLFKTSTGIVEYARDQYNEITNWFYDRELAMYDFLRGGWYNAINR